MQHHLAVMPLVSCCGKLLPKYAFCYHVFHVLFCRLTLHMAFFFTFSFLPIPTFITVLIEFTCTLLFLSLECIFSVCSPSLFDPTCLLFLCTVSSWFSLVGSPLLVLYWILMSLLSSRDCIKVLFFPPPGCQFLFCISRWVSLRNFALNITHIKVLWSEKHLIKQAL